MSRQYTVPRHLRWQLRSLGKIWRPVVTSCGLMEWSDREIGRLRPAWVKEFLRRHVWRCAFLTLLYLVAFTFLAASFERYWHWVTTVEAVAGEPVKSIDKWKSYCVVNPWSHGCTPPDSAAGRAGPFSGGRVERVQTARGSSSLLDADPDCDQGPLACGRMANPPGS